LPNPESDAQLRHSLTTVGVDALLTDNPERAIAIAGAGYSVVESDGLSGLTLIRCVGQPATELPAGTQKITFTSGSTGTPRGVCLSIEQQLDVAESLQKTLLLTAPVHLCLLPLSTLLENVGGIYVPLLSDGSISIPQEKESGLSSATGPDIPCMARAISRHKPASIILLPPMLAGLLTTIEQGWQPPAELRFIAVGGTKVAPQLIQKARQAGLPVYEGYGLSETGSVACLNHPLHDRIGSVGQPLPHVRCRIEDGEVYISGNTFLGYVGDVASQQQTAVTTGDLGRIDADGFVYLEGRRKNILITDMGRNISPEWLESEVLRHPEIAQCVVFGDARPSCSALIASAEIGLSDADIQNLLDEVNSGLPDYAHILRWHRLPARLTSATGLYTDNGRPRRAAIQREYAAVIDALYDTQPTELTTTPSAVTADSLEA
jgi:long-chain acyl-CoA synthetase